MTYDEFVSTIVTMLNIADPTGLTAFDSVIARCINYAELRLQREFDFLNTRAVDLDHLTVGGNRMVPIADNFVTIDGVSLITPAGFKPYMNTAVRVPLTRATRQFCDLIWPNEREVKHPDLLDGGYFAVFSVQQPARLLGVQPPSVEADENSVADTPAPGSADHLEAYPSALIIAPTPDDEYVVEQTGTKRATPLSADNQTNFMSLYMEDIYLAAALKWGFAYQRDFGAAANDPQAAQSWEGEYRTLSRGLDVETLRQKAAVGGYSPFLPSVTPMPGPAGPPPGPPQA